MRRSNVQQRLALYNLNEKEIHGRRFLVRADLNVLDDTTGRIKSDNRIKKSVPSINTITENRGSVIVQTHVGRPKGNYIANLSTRVIAERLSKLLDQPVLYIPVSSGPEALQVATTLEVGDVMMLENIRFDKRETESDQSLADELARLADAYVLDAFAAGHRPGQTSIGLVPRVMRQQGKLAMQGMLVTVERAMLSCILTPRRPLVIILGGGQKGIEEKINTLRAFIPRMFEHDSILLGGLLGNWIQLSDQQEVLDELRDLTVSQGVNLHLPKDPLDNDGKDLDFNSCCHYARIINGAGTVFWNGPVGIYEEKLYAEGTRILAGVIAARSKDDNLVSIVSGGDTEAAIRDAGIDENSFNAISTGGGAALKYLELGGTLPAFDSLSPVEE